MSRPQQGVMIVVVGPSGAGKDSVIADALHRLEGRLAVTLVRRAITRPADAGGEAHEAMSPDDFRARDAQGGFAVAWQAHGLAYGIPAETIAACEEGQTLIANGSRAVLARFEAVYPRLAIVNIVARPDIIAERLASRGRESAAEIRRRLERQVLECETRLGMTTIDNSGPLHEAGERLAEFVLSLSSTDGTGAASAC